MDTPPAAHTDLREELLKAAEQRAHQEPTTDVKYLAHLHEIKQSFRRLIDPGIMRPNNKEVALASLKTLATLSGNLLREPDNPKFQRFRPTNKVIRKCLVDVKGALEYAVALGFHLKVEAFQPSYIFNNRHLEDLRIGSEILKETLDREAEKQERAQHSKLTDKELREISRRNVQLNFEDDRKAKLERDRHEIELLAARAAIATTAPAASSASPTGSARIPPGGVTLNGHVEPGVESSAAQRATYEYDDDE